MRSSTNCFFLCRLTYSVEETEGRLASIWVNFQVKYKETSHAKVSGR